MNTEKIKTLQAKIVQWNEMQNELFDQCMAGNITKEEYRAKNNNLNEDIDAFKKEINNLTK